MNESIESVLSQTFVDFELLIIDDGSNDGSLSIIREYALLDSRVRYLQQENRDSSTLSIGEFVHATQIGCKD